MRPIYYSPFFLYLIASICMILAVLGITLLIWHITQRRNWLQPASDLLLFLLSYFIFEELRFVNSLRIYDESPLGNYSGQSTLIYGILCLILVLVASCLCQKEYYTLHNTISQVSIKEALDTLPSGFLCYYDFGMIRLINNTMDELSWKLTGKACSNGKRFWTALSLGTLLEGNTSLQTGEEPIVQAADGTVYAFTRTAITYGNKTLWELLASDITEEYQKSILLRENQKQAAQVNRRLKHFSEQVTQVTIEKEILSAKVRIHDELGHALLAAKHYLTSNEKDRSDLLSVWNRNIALLKNSAQKDEKDELYAILEMANSVGIRVEYTGIFPEDALEKKILTVAISECFTNTYRHAHGSVLSIQAITHSYGRQYILTNDGIQPTEDIHEKGGLKNLRRLVESSGGQMDIVSLPKFKLTITLFTEEPSHE